MSYPQDCLIVEPFFQIDSSQGDARGTYKISRKIGQKNANLTDNFSSCSFTHAVREVTDLRVLDVLRLGAEKGILWYCTEDDKPTHVSKEEFEWQVFLGTTYEDLISLPLPQKLSAEFKQFECTPDKVEQYFINYGMYYEYHLAFDMKDVNGEKLMKLSDQGAVLADWEYETYEDELKLFQQFEEQLFSSLK